MDQYPIQVMIHESNFITRDRLGQHIGFVSWRVLSPRMFQIQVVQFNNLLLNRGTRFHKACGPKGAPHLLMTIVIS